MADNTPLKIALLRVGLTAATLAELCMVQKRTVDLWLADETTPKPHKRRYLASLLHCPESELWPDA